MPQGDRELCHSQAFADSLARSRARRRVQRAWLRQRRRARRFRVGALALAALTATLGAGVAVGHVTGSHTHSAGVLSIGSSGPTVARLQRALGIPADGVYGRQTRAAVRRYQRAHGLTVDGVAGPQTLGALGIRVVSASDPPSGGSVLARIAQCESGGNPAAVSRDGRYRGKYQFSRATWRWLGGRGDPARAPESLQDALAAKLLARVGTSAWPRCGRLAAG